MNEWRDEELILFYYGELDHEHTESLEASIKHNLALEKRYANLVAFLDESRRADHIPVPRQDLNARIMQKIYEQQTTPSITLTRRIFALPGALISQWQYKHSTGVLALAVIALLAIVIHPAFDTVPSQPHTPVQHTPVNTFAMSHMEVQEGSKRLLQAKLIQHLEKNERLFAHIVNAPETSIKNTSIDLVDELLMLNRIYRNLVQKSKDPQLVLLLEQMEIILQSLKHKRNIDPSDVRERIDESDLIFKIRATKISSDKQMI